MAEDKKDILEFDLSSVSLPQAIILMMQAATKTVSPEPGTSVPLYTDDERLVELCEKLEAHIEDQIDLAALPTTENAPDDPDEDLYENVDMSDVHVFREDDEVSRVFYKGVPYGKLCNELVEQPADGPAMLCIKEWGHRGLDHEASNGAVRLVH